MEIMTGMTGLPLIPTWFEHIGLNRTTCHTCHTCHKVYTLGIGK